MALAQMTTDDAGLAAVCCIRNQNTSAPIVPKQGASLCAYLQVDEPFSAPRARVVVQAVGGGCGDDHGAQSERHVHGPRKGYNSYAPSIRSSPHSLQLVDDLHGSHLRSSRDELKTAWRAQLLLLLLCSWAAASKHSRMQVKVPADSRLYRHHACMSSECQLSSCTEIMVTMQLQSDQGQATMS